MKIRASNLFLVLVLAGGGAIACKKSGGGGGSVPLALAGLGVTAQVPEGATADKAIIGDGMTITGPDLMATVKAAGKDTPKTLAEAKEKSSMYAPTAVKEETLPDGWALTFENHGAMGTNYWVQVRRDVGGKAIWCEANVNSAEQQTNGLAVCKGLK
jgi:hypothetical protein